MALVTVIIASYNHGAYVTESIRSVIGQTYQSLQLIVIDDGSSDNSVTIIKQLAEEHSFVFLRNEKNIGLNNSIVKALEHARGDYISLLASDDYIAADKISKQIAYLESSGMDGLYSNGFELKPNGPVPIGLQSFDKAYQSGKALAYISKQDFAAPLLQSGLFSATIFKDSVDIRKEFKSDDWAFAIKVFRDYRIGFLNEPLFYYRLHPENTHKNYWKTFPMRIDVISRLVPPSFRNKAFANIFLSQATYLLGDGKVGSACRFFISSLACNFSLRSFVVMAKSVAHAILNKASKK